MTHYVFSLHLLRGLTRVTYTQPITLTLVTLFYPSLATIPFESYENLSRALRSNTGTKNSLGNRSASDGYTTSKQSFGALGIVELPLSQNLYSSRKGYFSNAFELNGASGAGIQIDRAKLTRAHYLLRPLMLRRLKVEVEKLLPRRLETKVMCSLSPMQIFWYKRLLLRDSKLLERVEAQAKSSSSDSATNQDVVGQESGGDWKRLQSLFMQLRQCCNHPLLFPNAEAAVQVAAQKNGETWDGRCNESIVEASVNENVGHSSEKTQVEGSSCCDFLTVYSNVGYY